MGSCNHFGFVSSAFSGCKNTISNARGADRCEHLMVPGKESGSDQDPDDSSQSTNCTFFSRS